MRRRRRLNGGETLAVAGSRSPTSLNTAGVPTAHGGEQWRPSSVRAVLKSFRKPPHVVAACSHGHPYVGDNVIVGPGDGKLYCRTCKKRRGRWQNMMDRCYKPGRRQFKNYGGRGIVVCNEWHHMAAFLDYLDAVLGPCPPGHSLDRIDNNGNYEPGNVRWADTSTQLSNRRNS